MKAVSLLTTVLFALPVCATAQVCTTVPSDPCEIPAEFTHTAVVEEAGIRVTLASTGAGYLEGDTVEFRMLFENIGTEYFCMNFNYDPDDTIWVMPAGCADVAAPCSDESPWSYPSIVYFVPGPGVGLQPGECRVFSYSWDTTARPATPGSYDVLGGLFEASFDEAVGAFRMPTTPVSLPIEITASVPVHGLSAGLLKARY